MDWWSFQHEAFLLNPKIWNRYGARFSDTAWRYCGWVASSNLLDHFQKCHWQVWQEVPDWMVVEEREEAENVLRRRRGRLSRPLACPCSSWHHPGFRMVCTDLCLGELGPPSNVLEQEQMSKGGKEPSALLGAGRLWSLVGKKHQAQIWFRSSAFKLSISHVGQKMGYI